MRNTQFLAVKTSYDKIITYDATSLLDALEANLENNGHASNGGPRLISKRKRPLTSVVPTNCTNSINARYHSALTKHETDAGVPDEEAAKAKDLGKPERPSSGFHSLWSSTRRNWNDARTSFDSANASRYQLKVKNRRV